jgi:decaprenylphospho-beta-D-erythro-pentofuranosid-2-ulose 2-reductase
MTRVLVLGGTSEIASAIVRRIGVRGPTEAVLAGRDNDGLEAVASELRQAGLQRVLTTPLEATALDDHDGAVRRGVELLGGTDIVILAVGVLSEREALPRDIPAAMRALEVGAVGAGSLLLHAAQVLREQQSGTIVVLSSVAAERPRASNPVYCAAKAALDALAQGLADGLRTTPVRIVVVRPGFVRTRMTRGLKAAPFATDADSVAVVAVRGLEHRTQTVWAPPYLRWVMAAIRLLPRGLFRRLAI